MVRAHADEDHGYRELSVKEYWTLFDAEARRRLVMSGSEFIAKYDAGEIDVDDPRIHSAAITLEMMLPVAREVVAHS